MSLSIKEIRAKADSGDAEMQYQLGWLYGKGRQVNKDNKMAVLWYQRAAEQGHTMAQAFLGWMYENGRGVERNYDHALNWYRKAAEKNNSFALFRLGQAYILARGVPHDINIALEWYTKAADYGNKLAPWEIGMIFILYRKNFTDMPKRKLIAYFWLTVALSQGLRRPQCFLFHKLYGMFLPASLKAEAHVEACEWVKKHPVNKW